jgi:ABC-type amino acid transport substrate-binding protein
MMRRGDINFQIQVDRALSAVYRSGVIVEIYERWFDVQRGLPTHEVALPPHSWSD